MEKLKKCVACRYCRVRTAIKTSTVLLAGMLITVVALMARGL